DPDMPDRFVRVSGARSSREREHALRLLIDHFFGGADPLVAQLRTDQFDPGRRTAIVVNSYEQVEFIKAHLKRTSSIGHRLVGVTSDIRKVPMLERPEGAATGQVEIFGIRDDWNSLVYPIKPIVRSVNIVVPVGTRWRQ